MSTTTQGGTPMNTVRVVPDDAVVVERVMAALEADAPTPLTQAEKDLMHARVLAVLRELA